MMNVRRATVAEGRLRVDFEGTRSWRDTFAKQQFSASQMRSRNFVHAETTLKRVDPDADRRISRGGRSLTSSARCPSTAGWKLPPGIPRRSPRRPRPPHFAESGAAFEAAMPPRHSPAWRASCPSDRLDDDAFVLLVQPTGKVFAATAAGASYIGASVGDFFSEVSPTRRFGDRAGVIETTISGRPHYARNHACRQCRRLCRCSNVPRAASTSSGAGR